MGGMLLRALIDCGFKGNIYPLHLKDEELMGLKCYKNVKDIPGPVDYMVVSIPARFTPQLMEDCAAKGVKVATFFAAGFSETGEEEGKRLEAEIARIARRSGMRIIGPNCMGIYCPATGLSFISDLPQQSGPLGFLSQSGGNTMYGIRAAAARGAYFSKAVSYGNACDINESNLLEYFTYDTETKIIAAYIEGVKDGERFFKTLKEATRVKPVIILKGGHTETGAATAASHTGSLASSREVWEAVITQTGAIQVYSIDEMVDAILPFVYMSPPKGRNVGIVGLGGGASVLAADDCASAGLSVPRLPEEIKLKLKKINTEAGNIFNNPVDTQSLIIGVEQFSQTAKTVLNWEGVDILILHVDFELMGAPLAISGEFGREYIKLMIDISKGSSKPVAIVLHSAGLAETSQVILEGQKLCREAKIALFPSFRRAANAISKFIDYHSKREK